MRAFIKSFLPVLLSAVLGFPTMSVPAYASFEGQVGAFDNNGEATTQMHQLDTVSLDDDEIPDGEFDESALLKPQKSKTFNTRVRYFMYGVAAVVVVAAVVGVFHYQKQATIKNLEENHGVLREKFEEDTNEVFGLARKFRKDKSELKRISEDWEDMLGEGRELVDTNLDLINSYLGSLASTKPVEEGLKEDVLDTIEQMDRKLSLKQDELRSQVSLAGRVFNFFFTPDKDDQDSPSTKVEKIRKYRETLGDFRGMVTGEFPEYSFYEGCETFDIMRSDLEDTKRKFNDKREFLLNLPKRAELNPYVKIGPLKIPGSQIHFMEPKAELVERLTQARLKE